MKKKILIICMSFVLALGIVVETFILLKSKEKKTVNLESQDICVYERNEQGQFRNTSEISDEQFDEYGNLTHYKYKKYVEEYGKEFDEEYFINYEFDENKKLIKAFLNEDNYIEISYGKQKEISKLMGSNNGVKYEYEFKYKGNETAITKKIYEYEESINQKNDIETEESVKNYSCSIKQMNNNNKEYLLYEEIDKDTNNLITKILCEKEDRTINYSNMQSLLNTTYPGYLNIENIMSNDLFNIIIPIFNAGRIIYIKNENDVSFSTDTICYYNKENKLLMCENSSISQSYYMYDTLNTADYKVTLLEKDKVFSSDINNYEEKYFYAEFKNYIDETGKIYKQEETKKEISEEEYEEKLPKYKQYFEENKIEQPTF